MTGHCAKFSDPILSAAVELLPESRPYHEPRVLDPFAGTGKGIDFLCRHGYDAWGVELEPEWASLSGRVVVGNALALPFADSSFDAVFTSPTYGNRMADRDLRESVAGTYAKSLGRHASEGSSCHLQWGAAYRDFHEQAWQECHRVLRSGAVMLLNVKDHYRNKQLAGVPVWHAKTMHRLGFAPGPLTLVPVPSLRNGQNGQSRVDHEELQLWTKP